MMKGLLSKYKKLDRTKEAEGAEEKASKRARVEEELHSKVDVKFLIIGAQKLRSGSGGKSILGEKTPEIIYCDDCAPRVKQVCPDAKFIFCIRDPINRAYSSWNMEVRTDKEQLPFEESLERELGSMGSMRTYGTAEYHYVQRGFYMDQIERFQKTFPDPSQMLVVVAERLLSHPAEEYSRVVQFLGLSNFTFVPETDNVGDYSEHVSQKAYEKLQEIYAPHNARLFEYLGHSIPEWTSVSSRNSSTGTDEGDKEREDGGAAATTSSTTSSTTSAQDKARNPPAAEAYQQGHAITTTAPPPPADATSSAVPSSSVISCVEDPSTSHRGLFASIGTRTGTDKISHHGYHRFYPPLLDRFRALQGGGMLEIGVDESRSLQLWLEYFPHAFVYGLDIGVSKQGPRFKIMQADQSQTPELRRLARDEIQHPLFFIIDDGSHIPEHQVSSFDYLFGEVLLPGGVYIIEDIETSYWTRNGLYGYHTRYGYHHSASVLEVFKDLLDELQREFLTPRARDEQERRLRHCVSPRTRNEINSIGFGHNCILVTKKTAAQHEEFDSRSYRYSKNL